MLLPCYEVSLNNPVENEAIMPANAAIAILDGAATPVSHNFVPAKIDSNGVASFQERISGVPVGYPTITWSVRAPTKGSSTYKVTGKLSIPKVITTTDASGKSITSVDYTNLATIDLVVSSRSTKQERTDLRVMMSNMLKHAAIVSTVDDLESFW